MREDSSGNSSADLKPVCAQSYGEEEPEVEEGISGLSKEQEMTQPSHSVTSLLLSLSSAGPSLQTGAGGLERVQGRE